MQLHELGLPVRIPAEVAVRGVLSRGQYYDVRVREGKRFTVSLTAVSLTKPGRAPVRMSEELVADMLTIAALAERGEAYEHPSGRGRTPEELDAGENSANVIMSKRSALVLVRLLSVRAAMRRELGMN